MPQVETFFQISYDFLAIANTEGFFIRLSQSWTKLGYTLEELKSKPFVEFVHPDDVDSTAAEAAAVDKQGRITVHFENRYRKKDDSYIWLNWSAQKQGDFIFAVAKEVTELKIKEQHRIRTEKLLAQGKMANTLAHEFNTPLGQITLLTDQAIQKINEGNFKDAESLLSNVHSATSRIAKMIENIHDILEDAENKNFK